MVDGLIHLPDGLEYVDAAYVKVRLEEAGKTLLCLPGSGTRPSAFKSVWPEIAQAIEKDWPAADDMGSFPRKSAKAISEMDEAFCWIPLVGADAIQTKRLLWLRLLIHPLSDKHIWSWRRLQGRLGLNRDTLAIRLGRGIDRICTRLNDPSWRPGPDGGLP